MAKETEDGFDAEQKGGKWRWSYASPGGSSWTGPGFEHDTKSQAVTAGRKWLKEQKK